MRLPSSTFIGCLMGLATTAFISLHHHHHVLLSSDPQYITTPPSRRSLPSSLPPPPPPIHHGEPKSYSDQLKAEAAVYWRELAEHLFSAADGPTLAPVVQSMPLPTTTIAVVGGDGARALSAGSALPSL